MIRKTLFLFFLIVTCQAIAQQKADMNTIRLDSSSKNYPVPPPDKNMLFYIQRTHNTNTIVYALNHNADSTMNEQEPVSVYWIRYADGGGTAPLSTVQRNFAYGVSTKLIDKEKKWYLIQLVAYNKKEIYLMNSKSDPAYHAFTTINGKMARLTRIFFKTDGGTFWKPNVVYVELSGKDLSSGKRITERFVPAN